MAASPRTSVLTACMCLLIAGAAAAEYGGLANRAQAVDRAADADSAETAANAAAKTVAQARVAEAEGRKVLGLAFQNKMVGDLKEGAGIEAQTVSNMVDRVMALPEGTRLRDCGLDECEVAVGQRLGADYVVTGQLLRFQGQWRAVLKLHETAAGVFLDAPVGREVGHIVNP